MLTYRNQQQIIYICALLKLGVRCFMVTMKKILVLNRYYKITRFYDFLRSASIKGGVTLGIGLLIFIVLDFYLIDTDAILNSLVTNYNTQFILTVFFVSEIFLGLVPPEIFIAWSSKMSNPWVYLFILATLSYLGGICAYFIGKLIYSISSIKNYLENKISKHIVNLRKWGGFFVIVGAMLPLPHSIVSLTCGLIKYEFKHYALWALFRFLRFFIYALVLFKVL